MIETKHLILRQRHEKDNHTFIKMGKYTDLMKYFPNKLNEVTASNLFR